MHATSRLLAATIGALLLAGAAHAQSPAPHVHADPAVVAQDPFAPVFLVTSRQTFQGAVSTFARHTATARNAIGDELLVSEIQAHQLTDISQRIHAQEKRCGGYFAFATRAEAERFVRQDRSRQAMTGQFLASYPIDNQATVSPWLPQVSEARIRATITQLSTAYPNRYYTTTHGRNAALWIRDSWQALAAGRSDISTELFTACGNCGTQPSVILTIQGSELPDEIVVLGGHLDSISNSGSGETMAAPGADDDASGVASLTEVIKVAVANGWKPRRTVKFMAYAGEEVGLRGSNAIAQSFKASGKNVVGVMQMDMTNYRSSSTTLSVMTDYSNAGLVQFLRDLFATYMAPTGATLGETSCGYACSDHASWTSAGYPAAMYSEDPIFAKLHTASDTLSQVGGTANASVPFVKLGLAFLGELAKTAGGTNPPPPPPGLQKGVPVTGLAAATGASYDTTMVVPANATNLTFTVAGGTGDADLYVKAGSAPTDSVYDCRPYKSGNAETCTIAVPTAGTYFVRLKAYAAFSGVSLVGDYVPADGAPNQPQTYSNGADVAIADNATVDSPITVSGRTGNGPASAVVAVNIAHTYRGDLKVDLVAPDGSLYNLSNRAGGSADNLIGNFTFDLSSEALNGTWKLRVNDNASGDTGKIDSWSVTF